MAISRSSLLTPQYVCRLAIAVLVGNFGLEDTTAIFRDGMGGITTEWWGEGAGVEIQFGSSVMSFKPWLSVGTRVHGGLTEWIHIAVSPEDRELTCDYFRERILLPQLQKLAFRVWGTNL